jgi:DNA-binding NarL/FixJ family response regulator
MASRIIFCDRHSAFRSGLDDERDLELVGEATSVAGAWRLLDDQPADVVLLGIEVAGGPSAIADMGAEASVIVISESDEPAVARHALQAGALGCMGRDTAPSEALRLVRRALDGMTAMTGDTALRMAELFRQDRCHTPTATRQAGQGSPPTNRLRSPG